MSVDRDREAGTATGSIGTNTAWTNVSLGAVTGTGTAGDPFTVVVVSDAADSAVSGARRRRACQKGIGS